MKLTTLAHTVRGALLSTAILAVAASTMVTQDCRLFRQPQTVVSSAQSYGVADLNVDGKTDIVAVVGGNLEIYLSNGASFAAPVTVPATLAGVLIGDLNNDGRPDIAGSSTDNES